MRPFFRSILAVGFLAVSACALADVFPADNPALIDQQRVAYLSGSLFVGSNFANISDLLNDKTNRFDTSHSDAIALVQSRAKIGVDFHGFRLAALSRQDWFGTTTGNTILAYQKTQASGNLPAGTSLPLQYELTGFAADGVQLGHAVEWVASAWVFKAGAAATLLEGRAVKRQIAAGSASALGGGGMNVSGSTTNTCTCINPVAEGFIPAFQGHSPTGTGYAVDLGVTIQHENGVHLAWSVADAVSSIAWRSVPAISLSGSSTFNGQFPGGRRWLTDFEETLPVQHTLALSAPVNKVQFEVSLTRLNGYNFPMVGASVLAENGWNWGVAYDTYFRAAQLSASNKKWRLKLQTDSPQVETTRQIGIALELHQPF